MMCSRKEMQRKFKNASLLKSKFTNNNPWNG